MTQARPPRLWPLHVGLLTLWFLASFCVVFFAEDLQTLALGWPIGFWFSAQGSVLIFIALVVAFAWVENRREGPEAGFDHAGYAKQRRRIHRRFVLYVAGLLCFLLALAIAERYGLPKAWGAMALPMKPANNTTVNRYGKA